MPATLTASGLSFRRLGLFFGVLTSFLALQLMIAPEFGLSLTAFTFIICGMIVFVLVWPDLERDIVQFAGIGAVLGGLGEGLASGASYFSALGALLGLIVGALIGDEIQISRKWYRLARQTRDGNRWWQRPVATSRWLTITVSVISTVALLSAMALVAGSELGWLPLSADSNRATDMFTHLQSQRLNSSIWTDLCETWFVFLPLAISIALSRLAARVPDQPLLVEGLFRRIGILQCIALLLFACLIVWESLAVLSKVSVSGSNLPHINILDSYARLLRLSILPVLLVLLAQVLLGKRVLRYWSHSGWLLALGILGLTIAFILCFFMVYVGTWRQPLPAAAALVARS